MIPSTLGDVLVVHLLLDVLSMGMGIVVGIFWAVLHRWSGV